MTIQPLSPELAKSLGVAQQDGALVSSVAESSPAAQAGVRHGDVIVEYDGHKVGRDGRPVADGRGDAESGKKVTMKVMRDGKEM